MHLSKGFYRDHTLKACPELQNHYLPAWCIKLTVDSPEPFNLTSFVLSLLLVFRTNASYGRWDNARKIWGAVTNRTRDLMRQVVS